MEPLIKFIDFRRIKGQILVSIIEPLEIVPNELLISVYRYNALSLNNPDLVEFRGTSPKFKKFNESAYIWDESACGSNLIIEDNGSVVKASYDCDSHQSVSAKIPLNVKGFFEWDVIIEKDSKDSWIGVCASENYDYEMSVGGQLTGWALGSDGSFWNSRKSVNYCPKFENGTTITVHLDMNKRTLAFTVNGTKYSEVSCYNLPSKLYPVVSLSHPGHIRIQPHR